MSFHGKKNTYVCDDCDHHMVTVDQHSGTTPFMTDCPKCKGRAVSRLYRVSQSLIPTHEWYRPTPAELSVVLMKYPNPAQRYAIREHVKMGGLLLRSIEDGNKAREQAPAANKEGPGEEIR